MPADRRAQLLARVEQASELPMLVLALMFLVAVGLPEFAELPHDLAAVLDGISWLIWGVFAADLVGKTYLARDRRRYLVSHWQDVLLVLVPFLRPIRLLRVLAISVSLWVDIRALLRYRTFGVIGIASLASVALAAALVYAAERGADGPIQTFPDALWWAMATITTVGYGDVYPKTSMGRGVAAFLMVIGVGLFGLLTARVAAFFVQSDHDDAGQKFDLILERLERLEQRDSDGVQKAV
jgi:voltage-gated potassium channel